MSARMGYDFYRQDVLDVAPALLGKVICRSIGDGVRRGRITEVEAYRGEEDTACHARAGKTRRTVTLYLAGGHTYVYLCYGIHHMLNVVTGPAERPQAALIRGLEGIPGPGRLTRALGITTDDNAVDLVTSPRLWIEDDGYIPATIETSPRIGIGYASEDDRRRLWRFTAPPAAEGNPGNHPTRTHPQTR